MTTCVRIAGAEREGLRVRLADTEGELAQVGRCAYATIVDLDLYGSVMPPTRGAPLHRSHLHADVLRRGESAMSLDRARRSPLHYAAMSNDVSAAEALLDAGADPSGSDEKGLTPLHFAAQEGSVAVAQLLLHRHALVDQADHYGNTPLSTAVFSSRGDGRMIELLRRWGADPLRANNSGQTPLGLARLIANYEVARFFADLT
ncbi:ankyrin repeat domain-containing protein [Streptosporangium sp. NPDC020145]